MNREELYKLREDIMDEIRLLHFSPNLKGLLVRCADSVTEHINCVEYIEQARPKA